MAKTKTRLTAYKIAPDELLDLIDAASIADNHGLLKRCGGGRLISDGYMCPHCGADPSTVYDSKGEVAFKREPGEKYYRKCDRPAKKVIAEDDLLTMIPTQIE